MGHSDPDESCIHFPQHEGDLVGRSLIQPIHRVSLSDDLKILVRLQKGSAESTVVAMGFPFGKNYNLL